MMLTVAINAAITAPHSRAITDRREVVDVSFLMTNHNLEQGSRSLSFDESLA